MSLVKVADARVCADDDTDEWRGKCVRVDLSKDEGQGESADEVMNGDAE